MFTLAETEAHNNNNSLFTLSIQIAFCLFTICLIVVATCNSPKQFVKMSCIELCGGFHTNHRDRCKFPLGVPPFYRHKVTPLPTAWATASSPLTVPPRLLPSRPVPESTQIWNVEQICSSYKCSKNGPSISQCTRLLRTISEFLHMRSLVLSVAVGMKNELKLSHLQYFSFYSF